MFRVFNCLKIQLCSKKQVRYLKDIVPVVMNYSEFQTEYTDVTRTPIFIMHGLMDSQRNWNQMAQKLAVKTQRKVYALEARNHGSSPYSPEHGSEHLAADVEELMRIFRLKKIIAIGYGMGGFCMMTLALSKPLFVEKAIILEASTYGLPIEAQERPGLVDILVAYIPRLPKEMSLDEGKRAAIKTISEHSKDKISAGAILQYLHKNESGAFELGYNLNAISSHWNDYSNYEESIQMYSPYWGPTLFIASPKANYIKQSHLAGMKKYFPYMQMVWIDAVGLIHLVKPNDTLDAMVHFLTVDKKIHLEKVVLYEDTH